MEKEKHIKELLAEETTRLEKWLAQRIGQLEGVQHKRESIQNGNNSPEVDFTKYRRYVMAELQSAARMYRLIGKEDRFFGFELLAEGQGVPAEVVASNNKKYYAYQKVLQWFNQDQKFYEGWDNLKYPLDENGQPINQNLSLDKGLLLVGNYGSGKTMIFRLMYYLYRGTMRGFMGMKVSKVEEEYFAADQMGARMSVVYKYGQRHYTKNDWYGRPTNIARPVSAFFDDLGTGQRSIMDYGNEFQLMRSILTQRADHARNGMITHATSNMPLFPRPGAEGTGNSVQEFYGQALLSRFFQMFNILVLPGHDLRKYEKKY